MSLLRTTDLLYKIRRDHLRHGSHRRRSCRRAHPMHHRLRHDQCTSSVSSKARIMQPPSDTFVSLSSVFYSHLVLAFVVILPQAQRIPHRHHLIIVFVISDSVLLVAKQSKDHGSSLFHFFVKFCNGIWNKKSTRHIQCTHHLKKNPFFFLGNNGTSNPFQISRQSHTSPAGGGYSAHHPCG